MKRHTGTPPDVKGGETHAALSDNQTRAEKPGVLGRAPSAVCRFSGSSDHLLRAVKAPDGFFILDVLNTLPVDKHTEEFHIKADVALLKKAYEDGFFQHPKGVDGFLDHLYDRIYAHLIQNIALARKSGACIAGYGKVSELKNKGRLTFMIMATDCKGRDVHELFNSVPNSKKAWVGESADLGAIFGKDQVMAIGFSRPHFVKDIKNDLMMLENLSLR